MFVRKGAIDPKKDKHFKTMRYEHSFLMQCVILKMKSTKAYVHIRKQGLLPLPSPSTIRRFLSSAECKFGFNSLALEHISDALRNLKDHERWGVLMWDEMAISKDLRFDPRTLKWKGIVDLAGACSVMVPNGIADHVLVFVFRPFLHSWIQPFAWFGTKGAASGVVLLELVTKAISTLFHAGAIVTACVSDGVSTNKSVMTQFGISGMKEGSCSVKHCLKEELTLNWIVDVPHLIKCIRNNFLTHRRVQVII